MMNKIIASILLPVYLLANDNTIYLECKNEENVVAFNVSIDKDNKKITHTMTTGYSFNANAFFSPTTISYKKFDDPEYVTYEIKRNNLTYLGTLKFGEFGNTISLKGQCAIIETKENKI